MIIKDWSGRSVGRVTRSAELSPPATSSHQALVISRQATKSSKQKQRTEKIRSTNKHLLQALTNSGYILRIHSKQKKTKTEKLQKRIHTFAVTQEPLTPKLNECIIGTVHKVRKCKFGPRGIRDNFHGLISIIWFFLCFWFWFWFDYDLWFWNLID